MNRSLSACILPLLPALAVAQTFVVDSNGGPGSDFTSIATAVAAVPEGANLEVRAGSYQRFQIDDKSLTIDCENGVIVEGTIAVAPLIEIRNLSYGKAVSLRGFRFRVVFGGLAISCRDSAGAIVLDDIRTSTAMTIGAGKLRAANCDHVVLRESTLQSIGIFDAAVEAYNSNVQVTASQLHAEAFCFRQGGGHLSLTGCSLSSDPTLLDAAVGFMAGGELTLNGGTSVTTFSTSKAPAIAGQGQARIDQSVSFGPGLGPIAPTITVDHEPVPATAALPGPLGGAAAASCQMPTGALGALFVGFPGPATAVAGIRGTFWVEPGAVVHAMGGGTLTGGYAVPNAPFVLGVQVTWQGVAYTPGTSFVSAGNASTYAHL